MVHNNAVNANRAARPRRVRQRLAPQLCLGQVDIGKDECVADTLVAEFIGVLLAAGGGAVLVGIGDCGADCGGLDGS